MSVSIDELQTWLTTFEDVKTISVHPMHFGMLSPDLTTYSMFRHTNNMTITNKDYYVIDVPQLLNNFKVFRQFITHVSFSVRDSTLIVSGVCTETTQRWTFEQPMIMTTVPPLDVKVLTKYNELSNNLAFILSASFHTCVQYTSFQPLDRTTLRLDYFDIENKPIGNSVFQNAGLFCDFHSFIFDVKKLESHVTIQNTSGTESMLFQSGVGTSFQSGTGTSFHPVVRVHFCVDRPLEVFNGSVVTFIAPYAPNVEGESMDDNASRSDIDIEDDESLDLNVSNQMGQKTSGSKVNTNNSVEPPPILSSQKK